MDRLLSMLGLSIAAVVLGWLLLRLLCRAAARDRLETLEPIGSDGSHRRAEPGALARWLRSAGYRSPGAARRFLAATVLSTAAGLACAWLLSDALGAPPVQGGAGVQVEPLIDAGRAAAPVFLFFLLALIPTLVVRARRRRFVREIDEDLSVALDLFATLADSGLAFDASMQRIQDALSPERSLSREFAVYRFETLAGIKRSDCLRRMADRARVAALGSLVSALVQAEQTGASITAVLRRQADELRRRRRDAALLRAQALPVKLTVPLTIGFLPALFVWTVGPALLQFIEMVEQLTR